MPDDGCFGCGGFEVFDVSSLAPPLTPGISNLLTSDQATAIAIRDDIGYVTSADSTEGLNVIDLSEPTSPDLIVSVETAGSVADIAIAGSHAYLATERGLQLFDLANPTAPTAVGFAATPAPAQRVAVAGDHAYVNAQW